MAATTTTSTTATELTAAIACTTSAEDATYPTCSDRDHKVGRLPRLNGKGVHVSTWGSHRVSDELRPSSLGLCACSATDSVDNVL